MSHASEAQLKAARYAIDKAGGCVVVAAHFGIWPSAVSNWYTRGIVPPRRVVALAKLARIPPAKIGPYIR